MAGLDLSFKKDIKRVTARLSRVQKKQVPFATALALTKTAQAIQRAETKQLDTKLDKPTKYTKGAIGYKSANKKSRLISASVFVKDIQARYLKYQVFGGTRRGKGQGTGVPVGAKLNVYGNIPGRRRKAAAWRKGQTLAKKSFIATISGIPGVWAKTGGKRNPKLRLMVAFEKRVRYRKRFPFFRIAEKTAKSTFLKNFNRALSTALRTAR